MRPREREPKPPRRTGTERDALQSFRRQVFLPVPARNVTVGDGRPRAVRPFGGHDQTQVRLAHPGLLRHAGDGRQHECAHRDGAVEGEVERLRRRGRRGVENAQRRQRIARHKLPLGVARDCRKRQHGDVMVVARLRMRHVGTLQRDGTRLSVSFHVCRRADEPPLGRLVRDPRPARHRPAGTVLHLEREAEPTTFARGMGDQIVPRRAQAGNLPVFQPRPRRDARMASAMKELDARKARVPDGLQVGGQPLFRRISANDMKPRLGACPHAFAGVCPHRLGGLSPRLEGLSPRNAGVCPQEGDRKKRQKRCVFHKKHSFLR